jgi:hypothetical protein
LLEKELVVLAWIKQWLSLLLYLISVHESFMTKWKPGIFNVLIKIPGHILCPFFRPFQDLISLCVEIKASWDEVETAISSEFYFLHRVLKVHLTAPLVQAIPAFQLTNAFLLAAGENDVW